MIQRKQTLFLLAVIIIAFLMLFVPFQYYNDSKLSWGITLLPGLSFLVANSNLWFPIILNFLIVTVGLFTIFKFNNRPLQYKLSNLLLLLNIFITGLFFLLTFINHENGLITFSFGAFLPIIGAIFAFLAARFIKKDEDLVRNSDRIR